MENHPEGHHTRVLRAACRLMKRMLRCPIGEKETLEYQSGMISSDTHP